MRDRVEAAEVYFERYLAARVRFGGAVTLREAWQRDVTERRTQSAARERAERAARQCRGLRGLPSRG